VSKLNQTIQVKSISSEQVASIRFQMHNRSELQSVVDRLLVGCGKYARGVPFVLYYLDTGLEGTDTEVCVPLTSPVERGHIHTRMLTHGCVLFTRHLGSVDRLPKTYSRLVVWAAERALNLENICCEVLLSPVGSHDGHIDLEVQFYYVDWETRLADSV